MKIHFACHKCKTKYVVTQEYAGKHGKCKNCGQIIIVPETQLNETKPNAPQIQTNEVTSYWFGYIYAVFVAYLAFVAISNFLVSLIHLDSLLKTDALEMVVESWTFTLLSLVASIWLAYTSVRLFRKRYSLIMIYIVALLHALNVLARGIIPIEVIYWLLLSGFAIRFFRKIDKSKKHQTKAIRY